MQLCVQAALDVLDVVSHSIFTKCAFMVPALRNLSSKMAQFSRLDQKMFGPVLSNIVQGTTNRVSFNCRPPFRTHHASS